MLAMKIESTLGKAAAVLDRKLRDAHMRNVVAAASLSVEAIRRQISAWSSNSTGALARSFSYVLVKSRGGEVGANIVSSSRYAGIHETGGTVKAHGSALTIPISAEAKGKRARDFGNRLFIVRKEGSAVLAEKRGKNGIKVHFVLKKSAYITPKNYITKAADEVRDDVRDLLEEGTVSAIRSAGAAPGRQG